MVQRPVISQAKPGSGALSFVTISARRGRVARVRFMVLFGALVFSSPVLAQSNPAPTIPPPGVVGLVQKAVVRALNFDRGDVERLRAARADFTPEGWKGFLKHLDGWLDDKGAPTFSSSFVASGDPTVVSQSDGTLLVTIPGTLKHSQQASSTTYQVVVEVRASGQPPKIASLKQTICGGSTSKPCQ